MGQIGDHIPVVNSFLRSRAHVATENDVTKADNNECVICYEEFKVLDGKEIVELDCNNKHVFHLECMEKWVETNNTCPMCREAVVKEEKIWNFIFKTINLKNIFDQTKILNK